MVKKMLDKFTDFVAGFFKKKPLPANTVFIEKPSFYPVILVWLTGIIAIIILNNIKHLIIPGIVEQIAGFFKGVKPEWVNSIFNKLLKIANILILFFVIVYHIKRQAASYSLTKSEIIVKKGFIFREIVYIPLSNVRNVSFSRSIIGLILRYGVIFVDTGGFAGLISMENIPGPGDKIQKILMEMDKK